MDLSLDMPVAYYDLDGIQRAARITAHTAAHHPPLADRPPNTVSLLVMYPTEVQAYPIVLHSDTPAPGCWTALP
jgi:hypothetical protein